MKCPKCQNAGVQNECLGKSYWYCRTCQDEIIVPRPLTNHITPMVGMLQKRIGYKPKVLEAALKYHSDYFNDGLLYLSNWPDPETPPDTMVLVTGSWDTPKGKYSISYDAYLPEEEPINIIKEEFFQAYEKARSQDRFRGLSFEFAEAIWAEMEADWNGEPEEE